VIRGDNTFPVVVLELRDGGRRLRENFLMKKLIKKWVNFCEKLILLKKIFQKSKNHKRGPL
jgi:hypothetical protein